MSRVVEIVQYGTSAAGGRRLKVDVGRAGPQGPSGTSGGGDHGALTGLADDDHTQYLTAARGDVRYDDRGQDSAATGLYAFSDFSRMTAGTIHNQGSSGSAIGDPRTWVDGRTAAGSGIDAIVEVAEIVSGVLRHRGTRLSAVASMLLPGGAFGGTPAHGTAHTVTAGYVADTVGSGNDGASYVRLGFLDGDNSNGYVAYLKAESSTANHQMLIARDDAGVPSTVSSTWNLGRRLVAGDRWSFSHNGNWFAVYLNGSEVGRIYENTYAASTFNVTTIVLSSENTNAAPPGANRPGVPWHALSVGSPIKVFGTAEGEFAQGNDGRFFDARRPQWGAVFPGDEDYAIGFGTSLVASFSSTLTAPRVLTLPKTTNVQSGVHTTGGEIIVHTGAGVSATNTLTIRGADVSTDQAPPQSPGTTRERIQGVAASGLVVTAPNRVYRFISRVKTGALGTEWVVQDQTPLSHAASHATGGTDALAPSDIGAVPTSRTVAGKALTADVTLTATDVGAAATSHVHSGADITSGTVAAARLGSGTPSASNFLRGDGTWSTPSGSGDVVGPASSVDDRVALFDGTTGKLLKQSAATLATVATSGSASDLSTGTLPFARLSLPVRRLAGSGISYTSPTDLFGTPPTDIQGNVTTSALAAGTMRLTPCDIGGGPTLASIAFEVSASGLNAGQSVSIGCYARASTGLPTGTPVWTLTQTVGTTTGTYVVSTTNALPEGGCWLALLNPSTNAGTVTIYIYQPTGPYPLALRSVSNRPALISTTGISALPDVSSYTVSNAASASVWGYAQQGVLFMLR